ncbi:hypothetical protein GWE18_14410 [Bradyrhizobium sp. CSA112]|uniref:hypothetical protein n=1 Tax=Bradyrhizobium sp. CSA112 TaxID=2699170 RepID=UPI0023B11C3A|nr:hypothetical protein [Bradyrhizobium sp. CSA112]MDE5454039.1 hypothetical protein [Bradyrhizobium sp. CSA112]
MKRANLDPSKAEDVNTFLQSAYSNSSARDVLSKLMTQREQYEGKAAQFGRAPGLAAAGPLMAKDPFVAYEAVFAQLRTLAGQAPIMDATAAGLNKISSGIVGLNAAINEGAQEGGWLNRFGKEAEERWATTKREASSAWDTLQKLDRATAINPKYLGLGRNGIFNPYGSMYPEAEDPMGSAYSRRQFRSKEYWEGLGREGASAESAARLRREAERFDAAKPFVVPGLSKTMTYGTGVSGGDETVSVSGEVHGEVKQLIEITASQYFETLVQNAQNAIKLAGQITSNGVGSTGKSSPDAAAPATPAQPTAP